jgi:diguanylate cyclase (GGDEF)-like protein/PAS domain S-box-containing protein
MAVGLSRAVAEGGVQAASGDGARLNATLARLIDRHTGPVGLSLEALLTGISAYYDEVEEERRAVVRSMRLMSDEAEALSREVREKSASELEAIVNHVKDVILTVDRDGLITSFNLTGERLFGYGRAEVEGLPLTLLLPALVTDDARLGEHLVRLATRADDTHVDLAAHDTTGCTKHSLYFPAEIAVSQLLTSGDQGFVVVIRDATERHAAEAATRDSEARYRLLVENAPEAIVVLDTDTGCFVDCNRHAEKFFRTSRRQLLERGEGAISPPAQSGDDAASWGERGYLARALDGAPVVFEWTHRDALGRDLPCEVRLVRLPTAGRNLVRASITDISERKALEILQAGERRVFEGLIASGGIDEALQAITEVIDEVRPGARTAVYLCDPTEATLTLAAGRRLPRAMCVAMGTVPAGIGDGSCAAAVYLRRQVIVADLAKDPFWAQRREVARTCGLRAAWSTPLSGKAGAILGTLVVYVADPCLPSPRDLELMTRMSQLAALAIEKRRDEAALKESESRYRGLFENVVEGVYQADDADRITDANPAFFGMLGVAALEELAEGRSIVPFCVDPSIRERNLATLRGSGELRNSEYELRRADGRVITVRENARLIRDERTGETRYEGTLADITDAKLAERELKEQKERAEVTLQSIGDAVITTDARGRIDYMNPVAEKLTGWTADAADGQPLGGVLRVIHEGTREVAENLFARCVRDERLVTGSDHAALVDRTGTELPIQHSAAPMRNREGQIVGAVIVFRDVSRERRLGRALSYQATHDALTGLINRREFERRLQAAVEGARMSREATRALIYVDLDQFKVVNDTCGHPAGDQLLKQITALLQSRIRSSDTLARLGGDEFGLLLHDCSIDQAMKVAESLRLAIRDFRFIYGDEPMQLGASVGVVSIGAETTSAAEVLSAVDVACYAAKDMGRNRVQLYDASAIPAPQRDMQWVSRLQRALEDERLEIYFQSIVPIGRNRDGRPHYELLLRMRSESGAVIRPVDFIPAAERYSVMPAIDRWVVRQAIEGLLSERGKGEDYTLAVNLSGTTLSDETFLDFLVEELAEVQIEPGALCFEITETAAIANMSRVVYFMRELKGRGVSFALDDFGSGFSSLAYLKSLPVDYLKIDGQFIEAVRSDPVDRSVVEAICQVARSMNLRTVAERVESAEVLEILGVLGVDYAQGFHIDEPRPLSEFPHRR